MHLTHFINSSFGLRDAKREMNYLTIYAGPQFKLRTYRYQWKKIFTAVVIKEFGNNLHHIHHLASILEICLGNNSELLTKDTFKHHTLFFQFKFSNNSQLV